jgi:formate dehydrogenase major subunit
LVEKIKEKKTAILYGMGITQNIYAIETITLMANLLILTDNYGKPGCGINPIRGQNNVQGACDLGLIPDYYPGYSKDVEFFEKFWKTEDEMKCGGSTSILLLEVKSAGSNRPSS